MKSLLGLAVVASLASLLIGDSGLGDVPSVAACDARYEDCDEGDYEESMYDACLESHRYDDFEFGSEWVVEKNAWADTYLAAEKSVAVYWRLSRVQTNCETGEDTGQLYEVANPGRTVSYICDPNYWHAESGACVPADRDYDCDELRAWGIVNIRVVKIVPSEPSGIEATLGSIIELLPWTDKAPAVDPDWMLLDDDHDGMGCEFYPDE